MPLAFVHTCCRARDVAACVAFYERLGLERRGRLEFDTQRDESRER